MKKTALFASAMVLGTGASLASAQTYQGSDTLELVAKQVTASCAGVSEQYLGGGSGTGESAMFAGTQDIAPMSRLLNAPLADSCRINIADDAIGVWRSPSSSCTNIGDGGAGTSAKDVLRLLYFGLGTADGNGSAIPVVNGVPSGCSSAARANLINNWNSIFACSGTECTGGLRHAFRRDDTSGTTDTLRAALGVSTTLNPAAPAAGGVPVVPFCNGNDVGQLPANSPGYSAGRLQQDLDPKRTNCASGSSTAATAEKVCGPIPYTLTSAPYNFAQKTLGVVLTIDVPTAFSVSGATVAASAADLFNSTPCGTGFKLTSNPSPVTSGATQICPDGSKPVGGNANLCFAPVTSSGSFACLATPKASPTAVSPTGFDGRTFNTVLRDAAGNIRNVPPAGTLTATRRVTTAFYRLHAAGGASGAGRACNTFTDATQTIGCFAAADACSIGYAGFEANESDNINVTLDNKVAVSSGVPNQAYLLYRKLWVNALHCDPTASYPYTGGAALAISKNNSSGNTAIAPTNPDWATLFQCFRNQGTAAAIANGFFAPAGANGAPAVQHY